YAPLRLADGSMLTLRDVGQETALVQLDASGAKQLSPIGVGRILEIVERDPGELIVLANQRGSQSLYSAKLKAGRVDSLRPLLSAVHGSVYDPAMLPDGTGLVFTADPDGVPNVYRLDFSTGSVLRLTDAAFGAFEPSVSPDGRKMAFVNYMHEQYQVAVQPTPASGSPAESQFVFRGAKYPSTPATVFMSSAALRQDGHLRVQPYRPFPSFLRPRSLIPVFRARTSKFGDHDQRLGPGIGASVSGADPLRQWAYSLTGFFQENRIWGGMILQTGNHVLRPFISLSDRPRSSILTINGARERVPYEERSVEIGGAMPVRLQAGTRNTSLAAGASAEYRSIRLLDSDAHPVTAFNDRITVNPFLSLGYGITANPRDLSPNAGLAVVSKAEVDVKTEDLVVPARSWRTDASVFVPVFSGTSRRFRILLGAFWRNRGSTADFDTFIPRGYDTEDAFLGSGTYLKAGAELVQPIAWVDRGIVLVPFSLQAIYLYGFTESTGRSLKWRGARSSAGAGMGFRILVAHHLGLDVRIGVARLLEESEWALTLR
ncbi:MAG: hypothetical protein WBW88_00045, partial [Rhodothermales bacterium]